MIVFMVRFTYLIVFAFEVMRSSGEKVGPSRHSFIKLKTMTDELLQLGCLSIEDMDVEGSLVSCFLSLLVNE